MSGTGKAVETGGRLTNAWRGGDAGPAAASGYAHSFRADENVLKLAGTAAQPCANPPEL